MTDEASRIERADIGEANISDLNVGEVNWGKVAELAELTTEIERQGRQSKALLSAIASGVSEVISSERAEDTSSAKEITNDPERKEIGAPEAINGANNQPSGAEQARPVGRVGSKLLEQVPNLAPKIVIEAESSPIERQKQDKRNIASGERATGAPKHGAAEKAVESRKRRTIEIGAPEDNSPSKARGKAPVPEKAPGFYLGDDGRVRRPDGTFANKVEARRFNGENDVDSGDGEPKKHNIPSLIARAFGVMTSLAGKGKTEAGGQVGNAAGVATGGSVFLAAKEMADLASDMKEAAKERGISSGKDIAPYLKAQLGSLLPSRKREGQAPRRAPKQLAPGEKPKSAIASQQDKQAAQQKAATESQLQQAEEQHGEVIKKLGEVIDAIKPKGPGMLDSAFDMAGDMWERRGKGGKSGKRRQRTRLAGDRQGGRSRGEPRGRRSPNRQSVADVDISRRQPKVAKVRAGMGKGLAAMPAVSSAAGRSAGAVLKGGAAMGGAAVGRMAGAGARAIPLVGQAIALGLAAYDGYDGYNDKEGQAKAFDLKDGVDATTGQKSAMAAARVLDLGGLTSGAAGLLGSAAGAMGMKRLQEALTFDSDDMARAIYEGMTLFDRKNPEEKGRSGDTTINMGGGITPRGVTSTTGGWKGTPLKFNGTEAENGLPTGYLAATAAVESGGNPNARNKSGATGMFQFMPKTAAGLGLSMQDALDPAKATSAMIEHTKQNQAYFEKTMGRTPEGRELYLMHQQGMGGGTKLLKNPNALAADVLNSKDVNGMQAVLQNGGRADMTAQEFVDMVLAKYDRAEAYNKANPGKAIDMDKIVGTKPKYEAPVMLRGGPKPGEIAPPLQPSQSPAEAPAAIAKPAVTKVAPPASLRPVSDIQSITVRNELKEKENKPYAPGKDTDAAMLNVLKSMDKSLKNLSSEKPGKSPAGGPLRPGGKPPVSSHPTMSGPMADFANDRG